MLDDKLVADVKALDLKPSDILVIRVDRNSEDLSDMIQKVNAMVDDGQRVLIVNKDIDFESMTIEDLENIIEELKEM